MLLVPPIYKNNITGKESNLFINVMPKKLTFDIDFLREYMKNIYYNPEKTIFKEVSRNNFLKYYKKEEIESDICKNKIKIKLNDFINLLIEALTESIYKSWKKDKFHLIYHSGGRDSRIISYIIRQLYLKYGNKWLGDVLFLCWKPEHKEFIKVMEFEGWDKNQYTIYNDNVPAEFYQHDTINFKNCWKSSNGMSAPACLFSSSYKQMVFDNIIPNNINKVQIYNGQFFNKFFKGITSFEKLYTSVIYGSSPILPQMFTHAEFTFPILSKSLYKLINYSDIGIPINKELNLLSKFELILNKDLSKLPVHIGDAKYNNKYRYLDKNLLNCYYYYFKKSEYFKIMRKHFYFKSERILWYSSFWNHYSIASLCEYLINNGYEINYEA